MLGKSVIRQLVTSQLDNRGYVLKEKAAPPRGFTGFIDLYRRRVGTPKTVFDVGVGHGTPWLYAGFPDAKLVLVEPLNRFEPDITAVMNMREAVWHRCALGETEGEVTMQVPSRVPTSASTLARSPDWKELTQGARDTDYAERTVPIRTLDEVAVGAEPPFVIKMDVEGAELNVLKGGSDATRNASLIIVEASIAPRYENESDLIDIGNYLKPAGFRLAEIIEMSTYGPDKVLAYLDAAFVRSDSGFWQH
jgi:FkbM family methyltransferase